VNLRPWKEFSFGANRKESAGTYPKYRSKSSRLERSKVLFFKVIFNQNGSLFDPLSPTTTILNGPATRRIQSGLGPAIIAFKIGPIFAPQSYSHSLRGQNCQNTRTYIMFPSILGIPPLWQFLHLQRNFGTVEDLVKLQVITICGFSAKPPSRSDYHNL